MGVVQLVHPQTRACPKNVRANWRRFFGRAVFRSRLRFMEAGRKKGRYRGGIETPFKRYGSSLEVRLNQKFDQERTGALEARGKMGVELIQRVGARGGDAHAVGELHQSSSGLWRSSMSSAVWPGLAPTPASSASRIAYLRLAKITVVTSSRSRAWVHSACTRVHRRAVRLQGDDPPLGGGDGGAGRQRHAVADRAAGQRIWSCGGAGRWRGEPRPRIASSRRWRYRADGGEGLARSSGVIAPMAVWAAGRDGRGEAGRVQRLGQCGQRSRRRPGPGCASTCRSCSGGHEAAGLPG